MKKTYLLVGGAVAAVLIIGSLFLVPALRTPLVTWFSFAFAPKEVQSALFLTGTDAEHLSLSTTHLGFVKTISYSDKTFVEVAQAKGDTVALLKDTAGKTDVYAIGKNGEAVALTSDGRPKQSLAIAPDDSRIVFSYVNESSFKGKVPEGVDVETIFDVNRYELALLDRASGKITDGGNGVHAHFIDPQTLFYVSGKGFVLEDLAASVKNVLADDMAFRMSAAPVFISSDSFVVQNPLVPQFDILKIGYQSPLRLESAGTVNHFDGKSVYALSSNENGAVYGLSHEATNKPFILLTEKQGDKGVHSFRFPDGFIPHQFFSK